MKSFRLILILSITVQSNCLKQDVFTTIFSSEGQVFISRSDRFNETKLLKNFDRFVTSLAAYEGYLYVSVARRHFFASDSAIFRAQLVNSTTQNWEEFAVMNNFFDDILCMVIVNGYIYAGRTDGIMWRCSTDRRNDCKTLNQFDDHKINAIDYNPREGKIYAALESGSLRRCSPNLANRCEIIHLQVQQIHAIKFEFDAVWLRVTVDERAYYWTWLLKCLIPTTNAEFDDKTCLVYQKSNNHHFAVKSIDATGKYLYYNSWKSGKIYRTDPKLDSPWDAISEPINGNQDINRFIIVR